MRKSHLNEEEKEILQSVERGEWKSVENLEAKIRRHRRYARNTMKQAQSVNIQISAKDLDDLQVLAAEEGVSYQILVASIVHKYASGHLVERAKIHRNANAAA